MIRMRVLSLAWALSSMTWFMFAADPGMAEGDHLAVELTDGSILVAESEIDSIPVKTDVSKVDILTSMIRKIEFNHDSGKSKVTFRNHDKLEGIIGLDRIEIKTMFGEVTLTSSQIAAITIIPELFEGLILHYDFEEDEGGRVTDRSSGGNHGKVVGAEWRKDEDLGGVYAFDGKDDYINCGKGPSLNHFGGGISVSAWVKPSSVGRYYHGIVTKEFQEGSQDSWHFGFNRGRYSWFAGLPNTGVMFIGRRVVTDKWTHIVGTYDGQAFAYYVDGVPNPVRPSRLPIKTDPDRPLLIGADCNNGVTMSEFYHGLIDEVMLWNRALSKADVRKLYRRKAAAGAKRGPE